MGSNNVDLSAGPQVPADLESMTPVEIKGLTIREIRYQRALVALQKEFCRERIGTGFVKLRNSSPFSKGYQGNSKYFSRATGILGKLAGGMNYVDYAVLGFTLFSNVRKIFGLFRKKKK